MSRIEEAQAEERTEQLIEQAYTYLREKTFPDGCSETRKRVIRKRQRYSAESCRITAIHVQMQAEGYDCGLFAVETVFFFSMCNDVFSMCNTAQLIPIIYILSQSCSLCIDIILKLLTNLLAITMPY